MLVISMFYPGDRSQVLKQAAWIKELGGCKNHELLVVRDKRAEPVPELLSQFGKVHNEIAVTDPHHKWPDSPSLMFTTVARHIEYLIKKPWLMLEPDAVPLKIGWLDILEQEYLRAKRPFMGAFVPGVHDAPDHMSGVGIYPPNIVDYAGQLYFAGEIPWDLVAASQVLANAHTTDLIQHKWDRSFTPTPQPTGEGFNSYEEFRNNVTTECVLFHADKGWRIPDLIRPLLFPPNGQPNSSDSRSSGVSVSSYQPLPEIKEGTINSGFIFKNGSWRKHEPNDLVDGNNQMGTKEDPSSVSNERRAVTESVAGTQNFADKPHLSVDGQVVISAGWEEVPANMEQVRYWVEGLNRYAQDNGFARMRVIKELKRVNLIPKGKTKCRPKRIAAVKN